MKYDKKLLTQMINESLYEVESVKVSIVTSSIHLNADNQERAEFHLDESYRHLQKLLKKLEEFHQLDRYEKERKSTKE